jgi:signal transduction histidine kinase
MPTVFAELQRYVGFGESDQASLQALRPLLQPSFPAISEAFYAGILAHPEARRVLQAGESSVGTLKVKLRDWLDGVFQGPWDAAYYDQRCRIGRVHVRIGLPQHYMFGAMNVVRLQLQVERQLQADPAQQLRALEAVNKVLDLELAVMLHTFREDLLAQQARVERLAAFGQVVGSIGHELRNPLGVMESSLFILKGRLGDDERAHKHADRIGDQLGVANRIITHLLDLIRDRPLVVEPVGLQRLLDDAALALQWPAHLSLAQEGMGGLPDVPGDASQLRQVFVNLLENALQAMAAQAGERPGQVRVRAAARADHVEVAFEDDGPGLAPAALQRLFEPLNTTRPNGIGLGLALCRRIAERHGGTLTYVPGAAGARFLLTLPRQGASPSSPPSSPSSQGSV